MKLLPIIVAALLPGLPVASAAEQLVTLGDSLTFAYEAEFGYKISIPFGPSYGDGFGSKVRNWAEILNDPAYRHASFDLGARDIIQIDLYLSYDFFFRQSNNWAIPGLKVRDLRRFINGDATFLGLLEPNSTLAYLLSFSTFDPVADFPLSGLESQIRNTATRLTFFIGGNDLKEIYGDIYNYDNPGTFITNFINDTAAVLDWVLALNPNIQIVVVNVPHVGITPDVKTTYPTDPVKTGRVTAVVRELNRQLAGLAAARGLGYADIFTPTLSLLEPAPLCMHGLTFANSGSTTGSLSYVWLNGPVSANFHPNTNAQALVANAIINAFNTRYHTGIAPLSATEILSGLLGKTATQIDMTFAAWMTGHGLTGLTGADDSDGDGIPAAVEFALGLNPTLRDAQQITTALVSDSGGAALELAYPLRLPVSAQYALIPASATDPARFTPFAVAPAAGADGLARARLPLAAGTRGFLRLQSTIP